LDRLCAAYLTAMDASDWSMLADLWRQAEDDAALEHALHEVNECLLRDEAVAPGWEAGRQAVLRLVEKHLASGTSGSTAAAPVTVGDVAARIAGDPATVGRLTAPDRAINAGLLGNPTPLLAAVTGPSLARLQADLRVAASPSFWRAFQQAAVLLNMARERVHSGRAAARPAGPNRREPRPPHPRRKGS
jgi:hypothetical protein